MPLLPELPRLAHHALSVRAMPHESPAVLAMLADPVDAGLGSPFDLQRFAG